MKYHLTRSEWPSSKNLQTINAREGLEKREPSYAVGGNVDFYSHYGKQYVKSLSCIWLLATPRTIACQAPPPMGFSRQEYWSGLSFPSPGDLLNPGIEPRSSTLQADSLLFELPGNPCRIVWRCQGPALVDPGNSKQGWGWWGELIYLLI